MLAVEADEAEVVTIEGLGAGRLTSLQRAFVEHGAVQCGFCIPGMVMSAQALLDRGVAPDDEEAIREGLSGNLCRCAGYNRIVAAVRSAARAGATDRHVAAETTAEHNAPSGSRPMHDEASPPGHSLSP